MDLDKFYSTNTIEEWKTILGNDLHYHIGSKSDKNIFEQTVKNLYKYIDKGSSVIDCGCGWGGPARMLMRDMNCDVTGVTISTEQAKYIQDFPVYLEDLNTYVPHKHFDTAFFLESFTHLEHPQTTLTNIRTNATNLLIKDFTTDTNWYNPYWDMSFYTKETYIKFLAHTGWKINYIGYDTELSLFETCNIWQENFKNFSGKKINSQLFKLQELCKSVCDKGDSSNLIRMLIIHATRV